MNIDNNKTILLLRTLSGKEFKAFGAYIKCPLFNKDKAMPALYQKLSLYFPDFKVRKENLFQYLYLGEAYDDKKMRYILSQFNKLLEGFLVMRRQQADEAANMLLLMDEYEERGLEKYYAATIQQLQKRMDAAETLDQKYHLHRFELAVRELSHLSKQQSRYLHDTLQEVVNLLDVNYLARKLKYSCSLLNSQNIVATETQSALLEEILQYLEQYPHDDVPAIAIYHGIIKTLRSPKEVKHYAVLKEHLVKYGHYFPLEELREMYTYALNFCIKQVNSGNLEFLEEMHKLHVILLQKSIILDEGELSQWHYKNFVFVGLRLEKFDWTLQFIHDYKKNIAAADRENAYRYNLAYWHFYRKDFEKAMDLLLDVDFTDVYYKLDSKSLLLKTYYELDESLALNSLIQSFRMFLRRNKKISEFQRNLYLNMVKFVKRLVKARSKGGQDMRMLEEEIRLSPNVADVKWLLSKVEDLKSQ